jgi:hypothetical protein
MVRGTTQWPLLFAGVTVYVMNSDFLYPRILLHSAVVCASFEHLL